MSLTDKTAPLEADLRSLLLETASASVECGVESGVALEVSAQEYEIELRLDGYKPLRASIFVTRGSTYKLRGQLEALADDQP